MCAGEKEAACYAVEREYLETISARELIVRIIRAHVGQPAGEDVHERKPDALSRSGVCEAVEGGWG